MYWVGHDDNDKLMNDNEKVQKKLNKSDIKFSPFRN